MNRILGWVLGFTKVGKVITSVKNWLDGKKQYIAGFATALPASFTILQKFSEEGTPYLLRLSSTPEFAAAGLGWGLVFGAAKGEKIRAENAEILAAVKAPPPAQ